MNISFHLPPMESFFTVNTIEEPLIDLIPLTLVKLCRRKIHAQFGKNNTIHTETTGNTLRPTSRWESRGSVSSATTD
jgi:hypothetical protein